MSRRFDLSGIDTEQIGWVLQALAASDIEECEIEQGEFRLSVKRTVRDGARPNEAGSDLRPAEETTSNQAVEVQASAVGVFYRAEQGPGASGVEAGARVKSGEIIGRIEVMGIPHNVTAPCDGVIESLLVEDGQAVEYGQPLVTICPSVHGSGPDDGQQLQAQQAAASAKADG